MREVFFEFIGIETKVIKQRRCYSIHHVINILERYVSISLLSSSNRSDVSVAQVSDALGDLRTTADEVLERGFIVRKDFEVLQAIGDISRKDQFLGGACE